MDTMIRKTKRCASTTRNGSGVIKEAYSPERAKGLLNRFYQLGWFPLRSIFRYTMQYLAGTEPRRALDVGAAQSVCSCAGKSWFAVTGLDSCKRDG
jgi:hypothetical protein